MRCVIANAVKQSAGLMKMSLKAIAHKLTDCFTAFAMTKLQSFQNSKK